MAVSLARKGKKTSFLNPSDSIAVMQGCMGYWWEVGLGIRYVGEEDWAATSTGILGRVNICTSYYNMSNIYHLGDMMNKPPTKAPPRPGSAASDNRTESMRAPYLLKQESLKPFNQLLNTSSVVPNLREELKRKDLVISRLQAELRALRTGEKGVTGKPNDLTSTRKFPNRGDTVSGPGGHGSGLQRPASSPTPFSTSSSPSPTSGSQNRSPSRMLYEILSRSTQLHEFPDIELRKMFDEMDTNGNGWLSRQEFEATYNRLEKYGWDVLGPGCLDDLVHKYKVGDDGRISFDEFCVILMHLTKL
eukprot:TRINITY_DN60221_c0_g1_i2.p1 TRINITY_DN60221_c0_g1~~TRINITY_DN60221_c0_g1_i2.p1  ORF type:complete len:304 (+),score=26.67 TRINITY_DN60221_c0_g1_i2:2-913(+)